VDCVDRTSGDRRPRSPRCPPCPQSLWWQQRISRSFALPWRGRRKEVSRVSRSGSPGTRGFLLPRARPATLRMRGCFVPGRRSPRPADVTTSLDGAAFFPTRESQMLRTGIFTVDHCIVGFLAACLSLALLAGCVQSRETGTRSPRVFSALVSTRRRRATYVSWPPGCERTQPTRGLRGGSRLRAWRTGVDQLWYSADRRTSVVTRHAAATRRGGLRRALAGLEGACASDAEGFCLHTAGGGLRSCSRGLE